MTTHSTTGTRPSDPHDALDRCGYDPTTLSFHGRFDPDEVDSAVLGVVDLVSTATGEPPTSLEPLATVVDPDALAALVADGRRADVEVTFEYCGFVVTVNARGDVVLRSGDGGGA
jgi:hypothetical protein